MHSTPHKTFVIMILNPISFTSIFIRYINADTCIKSSRENAVYINYLYCKCTRTNKQRGLDKKKKKLFFASIDQKLDTFSFNVYQGSPEERFNLSI